MPEIPLTLRIKKESHKEIARAQDIIIDILYNVFDKAVLHGGTAIWRCYHGNRFSEDIDIYIPKDLEKINILFKEFEKAGFKIERKKISENSIYSSLSMNSIIVRFEALFRKINGSLKDYETSESNYITIYSLTPEELIREKTEAYLKRLKIRDLYDIFFLLKYARDKNELKNVLNKFVKNYKKPLDESDIQALIFNGIAPSSDKMLNYIKSYAD